MTRAWCRRRRGPEADADLYSGRFPRVWCNGCTRAFHALSAGSSPVARLVLVGRFAASGIVDKQRPSERSPPCCPAAMAVGAHDLALGDLVENALPVAVTDRRSDVEGLVLEVIELEHHGVTLPTIDARVQREEFDQVRPALAGQALFQDSGAIDIPLAMRRVMLLAVGRATRSAHGVALPALFASPREVVERLLSGASAAAFCVLALRHRTNVCSHSEGTTHGAF